MVPHSVALFAGRMIIFPVIVIVIVIVIVTEKRWDEYENRHAMLFGQPVKINNFLHKAR